MTVTALAATTDIPAGRGRWRFTLHSRVFTDAATFPAATGIGELTDARSRSLERKWNQGAQLTFTLDGRSASAAAVKELQHDVCAWRWDENAGRDVLMFRGPVTAANDTISEQAHTVTFTCHDYVAMLGRRVFSTAQLTSISQMDQDDIVVLLLTEANRPSNGFFTPGSYFPLRVAQVNQDGTARAAKSGRLRDRQYLGSAAIGSALNDLAAVINGFDYDCQAGADVYGYDRLRIFYPAQGVTRADMALVYGSNVATVSRQVNSSDYANYWRVLGSAANNTDPAKKQIYAEAWNADANNIGVTPIGLWMGADDAPDVTVQSTLNDKAQGDLKLSGSLAANYSLGLRPGAYQYGYPNMGDTVPLVVNSGRLAVNTPLRVFGITYAVGDDGDENVALEVGRPPTGFAELIAAAQDTNALVRRDPGTADPGRGLIASALGVAADVTCPPGATTTVSTVTASVTVGRTYRLSAYINAYASGITGTNPVATIADTVGTSFGIVAARTGTVASTTYMNGTGIWYYTPATNHAHTFTLTCYPGAGAANNMIVYSGVGPNNPPPGPNAWIYLEDIGTGVISA